MTDSPPCQLCGADADPRAVPVAPRDDTVILCGTCAPQIAGQAELDDKHWFCLQESAWSELPAVQVVAWRMLQRLRAEGWARDLLEQLYIDDETLAWARHGQDEDSPGPTVDSNGTVLQDGDTVTLTKSLDVKGAGFTAKRGTAVRNIRLTDDPELIEGKVEGVGIFLKTCFLKKSG